MPTPADTRRDSISSWCQRYSAYIELIQWQKKISFNTISLYLVADSLRQSTSLIRCLRCTLSLRGTRSQTREVSTVSPRRRVATFSHTSFISLSISLPRIVMKFLNNPSQERKLNLLRPLFNGLQWALPPTRKGRTLNNKESDGDPIKERNSSPREKRINGQPWPPLYKLF